MVTNVPNICLTVLLADCVPILLYDPSKVVIGAVHAGWKGTLRLIAQEAVKVFQEYFGSSSRDILCGIGPSIGPCCYQVGPEVISQVKGVLGSKQDYVINESAEGRGHLDLWTANFRQLVEAGISKENIELAKVCTCDRAELFFSYRGERGKTGRFGAGILVR
jgi:YfiH family protein